MNDRIGEESIAVFTPEGHNALRLSAKTGEHLIDLRTDQGAMTEQAERTIHFESDDTHTLQTDQDHTIEVTEAQHSHTRQANIEHKAKTDIRYRAGDHVQLKTETDTLNMKAGKDAVIQVQEHTRWTVRHQDMQIIAEQGQISLHVAKAITFKGQGKGNITLSQNGGSIVVDTNGAIEIASHTVNIDGDSVYVHGASVSQGGSGAGQGANGQAQGVQVDALQLGAMDRLTHLVQHVQPAHGLSAQGTEAHQDEDIIESPLDVVSGGVKQAWQEFMCKQRAIRIEWFAEQGKSVFTDKATGRKLTPQEVAQKVEESCLNELTLDNADEAKGAQAVNEAPQTAAAIAAVTAAGSKGRSILRDPKDFYKDMKGIAGNKKTSANKDKKDQEKKCEYQLSKTKKCSKPLNKTCPLKNKHKRKKGENIGNSGTLARNIMKNLTGKTDIKQHQWYYQAGSIAAHHIIVSESVATAKWKTYFDLCGYDINHHNNGVMLPTTLESACQLKVPLHRSNHSKGIAKNRGGISYVRAVKREIKTIVKDITGNKFCNNPKALESGMNAISNRILKYIDHYIWTLTSDGDDYAPTSTIGCANVDSIPAKVGQRSDCEKQRQHQLRHPTTKKRLAKSGPLSVGA